jgi:hypothetical protein
MFGDGRHGTRHVMKTTRSSTTLHTTPHATHNQTQDQHSVSRTTGVSNGVNRTVRVSASNTSTASSTSNPSTPIPRRAGSCREAGCEQVRVSRARRDGVSKYLKSFWKRAGCDTEPGPAAKHRARLRPTGRAQPRQSPVNARCAWVYSRLCKIGSSAPIGRKSPPRLGLRRFVRARALVEQAF